jgi:hypothetical protein
MTLGDAYFLLTVLVLLGGIITTLIFTLRRLFRGVLIAGGITGAWIIIYIIVLISISLAASPPILNLKQEHCFDEMCFSVLGSNLSKSLNGISSQHATFLTVEVQLRNAAKRSPQKPSNAIVYLVDESGHEWDISNIGQKAIGDNGNWDNKLEPGQTEIHRFVFDLDPSGSSTYLVITEGPGFPTSVIVGDENSWFHPKTRFRLV